MAARSWHARLHAKLEALRMLQSWRGWWFYAQRRVLSPKRRATLASLVARFRRQPLKSLSGDRVAAWQAQLRSTGYCVTEGILDPAKVVRMRDHLRSQSVYAPYLPGHPKTIIDREPRLDTHVLWYEDETVLGCPHALEVANHPDILQTVQAILGCRPTLSYLTAWWSVRTVDGKPRQAENFHRDVDDLAFIKFFIYLTDVDGTTGPHVYVRGSHRQNRLLRIRRYADDEVLATYGEESLVQLQGPAGTSFLENTFGLHRGEPVTGKPRLILQAVYSQTAMPYSPRQAYPSNCVWGEPGAYDPYVNRLYVRS